MNDINERITQKPATKNTHIRVAAIQMVSKSDFDANMTSARKLLRQAKRKSVDMAVLPENFLTYGTRPALDKSQEVEFVETFAKMAKEIENVKCFKIECAQAANKLRALIHKGGNVVEGPFDGEEGITLFEDLQAGARGNMSSAMLPDLIGPLVKNYIKGNIKEAEVEYNRVLPLINYENRQCGFRATKTVFKEGGVIKSDFCRHPIPSLDKETKKGLLDLANNYDLIAMKWGL